MMPTRRILNFLFVVVILFSNVSLSEAQSPDDDAPATNFQLYLPMVSSTGDTAVTQQPCPQESAEDENTLNLTNKVVSIQFQEGQITTCTFSTLGADAFLVQSAEANDVAKIAEDAGYQLQPEGKIHPELLTLVTAAQAGATTQRVVINFQDNLQIPRFPEPVYGETRESTNPKQVAALAQAERLVENITALRAANYQQLTAMLQQDYQAKVSETFWLINAVVAEMPLSGVTRLAERKDVLYIEPEITSAVPPQNTNTNDDVQDGRARINSDPYFNLNLAGGFIGLLDTGVHFTHVLFNSPSQIGFRRDCVNGGTDCATGTTLNPNDDCWNHGTSSAGIITANTRKGNAFRGVTAVTLDSFKVYPNGCGGLSTTAAVRGFQRAVVVLDRVIVAEMQGSGGFTSSISTAADNAFDAGAVIIAANGNNGSASGTVNVPANAHKVIGVGAFNVETLSTPNYQSRGPTSDGRIKPDIQAPTDTETASNASTQAFQSFGGTSGATPYAAGVAALMRNWLRGTNFEYEPGQVYAMMILSGQTAGFNNTVGAGRLRMPTDGHAWWGKVTVSNNQTIDIPIGFSATSANTLDGALWWPESASQTHNDIDLSLIDPSGVQRASSTSINSVFERARVSGSVVTGTWKLRIRGFSVTGSQVVYYGAHVRQ